MAALAAGRRIRRPDAADLLQVAVHLAALAPLVKLIWDGYTGNLTVNPIQEITARTGKTALILLTLSLACTPASSLFGFRSALRWRRPLGLYAFLYAALHFLTFTVLDYGLDPSLLREAIFEKRYALIGFMAFVLLIPLAITSTRGWMKRLGRRWKQLHRLVYPAALLVVVHYIWLVKSDIRTPLAFGAIIVGLLAARTPPVKRAVGRMRTSLSQRRARRLAAQDNHAIPAGNPSDDTPDPVRAT
jgi:sulfoxide reductase heme-binding subunit YedZ